MTVQDKSGAVGESTPPGLILLYRCPEHGLSFRPWCGGLVAKGYGDHPTEKMACGNHPLRPLLERVTYRLESRSGSELVDGRVQEDEGLVAE